MKLELRNWGTALVMMALGMGCSSTSLATAGEGGGGAYTVASVSTSPIEKALSQTDNYFITQYHHVKFNPQQGGGNNANCGPTSLAMAVRAFGVEPSNLASPSHAHDLILYVRKVMTGSTDENTWTYPVQVLDGAHRMGLNAEMVYTIDGIKREMAIPGRLVVVNVNPSPAYADELAYPYDGGHFALLTGIHGDRAYVNDPLGSGPLEISTDQLNTALTTPLGSDPNGRYVAPFDGGVAVWR